MHSVCADCKNPYPYLQKAHILARHKGGTDDPSNIILICPNCHHLRDRDERVMWLRKRWSAKTPEQRSAEARARMAALTPEQRTARGARIAASKTGRKNKPSTKPRGPKVWSTDQLEKRAASVRAAYEAWTPEQRAAHSAKIRAAKALKRAPAEHAD